MELPLSRIVSKSCHLQILKVVGLYTTQDNRNQIMDFCGEIVTNSDSIYTLYFAKTDSSASAGEKFWSTLADYDLDTLVNIGIEYEY